MQSKSRQPETKRYIGKVFNILLVILILLLVFVPDTKTWFMTQLIRTGVYNARPEKTIAATSLKLDQLGLLIRDSNGVVVPAELLEGKIVFMNFWATWCPPCRAEMPSLKKLYSTFKENDDIIFLFISEDEDPEAAKQYLQTNKFDLPLYTASGQAAGSFYTGTLPTTLLFDKTGQLNYKHEGMANYNSGQFISRIRSLQ
jgi:thiol-disulfide isomerase/thioredoxin